MNTIRCDNITRDLDRIVEREFRRPAESRRSILRNPLIPSISYDTLVTDTAKEEALSTLVSEILEILKVRKPETGNNVLIDEIRVKAESIGRKKKRRALLLTIMRAVSALTLFLSLGLSQFSFHLYLLSVVLGCVVLGVSAFLERWT